jgi:hypothetical protein
MDKSKPTEWTIVPHFGNISEKDLVNSLLLCYSYHNKIRRSVVQDGNKSKNTKGSNIFEGVKR